VSHRLSWSESSDHSNAASPSKYGGDRRPLPRLRWLGRSLTTAPNCTRPRHPVLPRPRNVTSPGAKPRTRFLGLRPVQGGFVPQIPDRVFGLFDFELFQRGSQVTVSLVNLLVVDCAVVSVFFGSVTTHTS